MIAADVFPSPSRNFAFFLLPFAPSPQLISVISLLPQQPLTVWWDHGVPGHRARLHVGSAARREVAKCLSPLETEAHRVLTSNRDEDASETTPYAILLKVTCSFFQARTCLLLCVITCVHLRMQSYFACISICYFSILWSELATYLHTSGPESYLQLHDFRFIS